MAHFQFTPHDVYGLGFGRDSGPGRRARRRRQSEAAGAGEIGTDFTRRARPRDGPVRSRNSVCQTAELGYRTHLRGEADPRAWYRADDQRDYEDLPGYFRRNQLDVASLQSGHKALLRGCPGRLRDQYEIGRPLPPGRISVHGDRLHRGPRGAVADARSRARSRNRRALVQAGTTRRLGRGAMGRACYPLPADYCSREAIKAS